MRNQGEILRLLHNLLGSSSSNGDEHSFKCPFCNHRKKKLQVSVERSVWHCWVCNARGRSISYLFKKAGADKDIVNRVRELTSDYSIPDLQKNDTDTSLLFLPKEFISLLDKSDDVDYNNALRYVESRGITREDIIKHNIGYCDSGDYANRIIIPSYDSFGRLNYFIARAYYEGIPSYKNPPASKNIVMFDLHINWNEEIVLVEGVMDAIALKRNAVPLLGKFVQKKLHDRLMSPNVKSIAVSLDFDARYDALKIVDKYMRQGKTVRLLDVNDKDPSGLGFDAMEKIKNESVSMDLYSLIKQKIYA